MSGLVRGPQLAMLGAAPVEGYERDGVCVRLMPKVEADALMRAGHYSGTVVWSSSFHFGVYVADELAGVLQYGPAMNPASGASVVAGTEPDQWLELNRMWLADDKPANLASRAVGYTVRVLRHLRPRLAWVQAFADERCGKLGAVYQACGFLYCGSHTTTFYNLDGEWYHQSAKGRARVDSRGWGCGPRISAFLDRQHEATPHEFRQFRYVRPLRRWARRNLLLPVLPYPKPDIKQSEAA